LLASSDHRLRRLVHAVQGLRASGVLRPPVQRVLSASQAARAFAMAEDANASGQYVVQLFAEPIVARPQRPASLARPNATYLVTGGLGGFGIEVARWLVRSGARHLALAGRSGAKRPAAQQLLAELAQQSIDVGVFPVDVSDGAAVGRMVDSIRSTMPPIAGVVHSAAVLEDAVLTSLDPGQITRVLEPKALCAWHLHLHTLDDPLDFFVMFSSFASVLGNIGQAAYASANAFLDSLARYRQARDLPALAVNWGPIAAVGIAARDTGIAERLLRFGITPIAPVQALDALTLGLTLADTAQLAVVDIDWAASIQQAPAVPAWKLFAEAMAAGYDGGRDGLHRALRSLPGHLWKGHLEKAICEAVAGVLRMPVDRIEIDKPLSGYGLDSLTALEISLALEALGVDITVARLLSGLSVGDLAPLAETRLDAEKTLPSNLSLNLAKNI
jgi:NAD(P)-dependent dehydrogenase (short-subunit alcohol dehydrogenase family)/acyl carrier protein